MVLETVAEAMSMETRQCQAMRIREETAEDLSQAMTTRAVTTADLSQAMTIRTAVAVMTVPLLVPETTIRPAVILRREICGSQRTMTVI